MSTEKTILILIIAVIVIVALAIVYFLFLKNKIIFPWQNTNQKLQGNDDMNSEFEKGFTEPDTDDPQDDTYLPISVAYAQTIGSREDQEDAYGVSQWKQDEYLNQKGFLAVMADGIGGLEDGQVASNAAVKGALGKFEEQDGTAPLSNRILEITAAAHQNVVQEATKIRSSCGCTFLSAMISDMELCFSSVGDSRIALYRGGVLLQLNREHVVARESDEKKAFSGNNDTESERRRKAITAYLGKPELRTVDRNLNPIQLLTGDCIILMSDGVFTVLDDSTLAAYLSMEPKEAAKSIINAVLERKVPGQDNATIVVVKMN